jgi:hypothetical protein
METETKRPAGITILAGAQIFIGCANAAIALFPMTGIWLWGNTVAMWVAVHPGARPFAVATEILVFAIYTWLGVGLWRLRPWARRAEIVFLAVVGLDRLGDALFVRPLAAACGFIVWYAILYLSLIWYLTRPQVVAAFDPIKPKSARKKISV